MWRRGGGAARRRRGGSCGGERRARALLAKQRRCAAPRHLAPAPRPPQASASAAVLASDGALAVGGGAPQTRRRRRAGAAGGRGPSQRLRPPRAPPARPAAGRAACRVGEQVPQSKRCALRTRKAPPISPRAPPFQQAGPSASEDWARAAAAASGSASAGASARRGAASMVRGPGRRRAGMGAGAGPGGLLPTAALARRAPLAATPLQPTSCPLPQLRLASSTHCPLCAPPPLLPYPPPVIVDPEFGEAASAPGKPRWFSQLQQQLRIAKFEHAQEHQHR
jgi:hypothetical protein